MSNSRRRPAILVLFAIGFLAAGVVSLVLGTADPRSPDFLFGVWRFRNIAVAGGLFFVAAAFLAAWISRAAAVAFWASVLPALFLLGLLEVIGRIGLVDWSALIEPGRGLPGGPGWTLQPNISVEAETYQDAATRFGVDHEPIPFKFQTDQFGFRNSDNAMADIIILGDSIVLGALVPKSRTVDSIVAEALNTPVAQAALLGISIQRQHEMLLESGMPLDGRRVVQFFFEGNDLLDSFTYRNPEGDHAATAKQRSLLKLVWSPIVRLSNPTGDYSSCNIGDQTYYFIWARNSFEGRMDEFDPISASILTFKQRIEAVGGEYALVFVPTKYRVLHNQCEFPESSLLGDPDEQLSDLPDIVRNWAVGAGIDFLDLTDTLQSRAADGVSPWFWGDTHWNIDGHAIAGEAIASWIENKLAN